MQLKKKVVPAALAVLAAGAVAGAPPAGAADPVPAPVPAPKVLTADPLPTWQTNGVVYAVEHVNGVVYVGGNFTSVRPPGAKPGTGEVKRKNMAAFDAKTGALLPFSHTFTSPNSPIPSNGVYDKTCSPGTAARTYTCDTVYEIRKSPDGQRIYVGGDFTWVDGRDRRKLAAFVVPSGALDKFLVTGTNGRVRSLAVSSTTVYAGGLFTSSGGASRSRLAAYNRTTGALLPWAPTADKLVLAMVMAPDNSRVIIGGQFDRVNGASIHALAAVEAGGTGRNAPWESRPVPGTSYITDLVTDSDTVYASANGEGWQVFDGRLAADPYTGALRWQDKCLGATWSLALLNDVLYSGSHAHDCSTTQGGFPESWFISDTSKKRHYRFLAETARTGQPVIQHWFPTTNGGIVGQLGPRTMTTDGEYLWAGGEFTTVNNVAQQGLTRFTFAPDVNAPLRPDRPVASSFRPGEVIVSWTATEDLDDATLTYTLYRGTTKIATVTQDSKPWLKPAMSFRDTGLQPGRSYTYQVTATDPDGNVSTKSFTGAVTVAATNAPYSGRLVDDGATSLWRLGERSGTSVADSAAGGAGGTVGSGVTLGTAGAIASEPDDTAVTVDGTSNGRLASKSSYSSPGPFSLELWFNTTTTTGGKLVGFGNAASGDSSNYDRHVYMNNNGQLLFGAWTGSARLAKSAGSYNDGKWHHLVATLGADGTVLYVDGAEVGRNSNTTAQSYDGYWRLGGDSLKSWPEAPSSYNFKGSLDSFAVFPTQLTAAQVAQHYTIAKG